MKAKAPSRSSGKLTISFGLVSVPVNVFSGVDDEAGKVKREMRSPKGNPVKFPTADAVTGKSIERSDTYLVYVTDEGVEVTLSDDEIAYALGEANGTCEIIGFFPLATLSEYVTTGIVQVRPQTTKSGKQTLHPYDKPYALLMSSMAAVGKFALLKYTLRGKPHLGALTSDGTMRVVCFENEVKAALPLPEIALTDAEVAMGAALVQALAYDEAPQMDSPLVKVHEFAKAKAAGVAKSADAEVKQPETQDLMAALTASLAAVAA